MDIVSGEVGHLKAEGAALVGQYVVQIGAGPVHYGHKVVADVVNAGLRQVAYGLSIVVQVASVVAAAGLDIVVQGHALDHRPFKSGALDQGLALVDGLQGPDLAGGNLVQSRNNTARPRLGNLLQGYGVPGPKPTPCLFHSGYRTD